MIVGVIDGIEEGLARIALDDGGVCTLPARCLPRGASEGDRVSLAIAIDPVDTERARAQVRARRERLTAGDDGGDLEL